MRWFLRRLFHRELSRPTIPGLLRVAVAVEPDDDGYHAYTPGLRGIHADGRTADEAVEAIRPLIALYLDSLARHGDPLPVGPDVGVFVHPPERPPNTVFQDLDLSWPIPRTSGDSSRISPQTSSAGR